ncbi:MAG: iron-containing alcohol dehydrogenase [Thermodesulfovibrionales bacterium]|nr:iron-containing alcohol dehydrogenase [Thermodesulfovibrionales bacterium]
MSNRITIFRTTQRIVIGENSLNILPNEIKNLKGTRPFIVTDKGIVQSGIFDRVLGILKADFELVSSFTDVIPEPPMEMVDGIVDTARDVKTDVIVGIGGGSSMDTAKVISVLLTNDQSLESMIGVNLVKDRGLPLILIPTTAGTGSEVTPIAIFTDTKENLKKGVVSDYLFPSTALLDPTLTLSLPPSVTAASGIDALIHAIEAYTSVNATPYTDYLALRAVKLIYENIRTAWARGNDVDARMSMLEGSLLAGQAFANAGVTAVHAFAYPLGGEFHIPHGVSNAVMFCPVMRFNMHANITKFASISDVILPDLRIQHAKTRAEAWIQEISDLMTDLKLPKSLKQLNIPESAIEGLSRSVLKVTRLLANNPRVVNFDDAKEIYSAAFVGE